MKSLLIAILIIVGGFLTTPTECDAIDPVTLAILAPIAMKAAEKATPYVLRGLMNGGRELLQMGLEVFNILRLPLGIFQTTLLAPWYFGDGMYNLARGGIVAPIYMVKHAIFFPIQLFNVF